MSRPEQVLTCPREPKSDTEGRALYSPVCGVIRVREDLGQVGGCMTEAGWPQRHNLEAWKLL